MKENPLRNFNNIIGQFLIDHEHFQRVTCITTYAIAS
jgi:hypothetical protein